MSSRYKKKLTKFEELIKDIRKGLHEAQHWLWDELELVEAQNKALEVAVGVKAIREQWRQIKAGESKDSSSTYNLTKAISYLDKVQECIEKDLDLLRESQHRERCFPYCW
ncbi:hypothetical protein ACLB2K_043648 [Fragaria x ananassa]